MAARARARDTRDFYFDGRTKAGKRRREREREMGERWINSAYPFFS